MSNSLCQLSAMARSLLAQATRWKSTVCYPIMQDHRENRAVTINKSDQKRSAENCDVFSAPIHIHRQLVQIIDRSLVHPRADSAKDTEDGLHPDLPAVGLERAADPRDC